MTKILHRYTGAVLHTVNADSLFRADLRGADLRGANLFRADLSRADLREADLRGANLFGAVNAPLIIAGLRWLVSLDGMGRMQIGCQDHLVSSWAAFDAAQIDAMHGDALAFWQQHGAMLLALAQSYRHEQATPRAAALPEVEVTP